MNIIFQIAFILVSIIAVWLFTKKIKEIRRNIIHKRFGNQEMYFERPGNWLPNLKLLPSSGTMLNTSTTN